MIDLNGPAESKESTAIAAATDCTAIKVVGKPHPLKEAVYCNIDAGSTISDLLSGMRPEFLEVRLNGEGVPKHMWRFIRPKPGTVLEVYSFPQGGNKEKRKQTLAMIVLIVATVAAMVIMGPGGAAIGLSAWGSVGVAAAISVAGALAAGALIKAGMPKVSGLTTPEINQTRLNGISGTSNEVNPYGVIPLVIGEMMFFPNMAAMPYTHTLGGDQYVHLLFDFGYGNLLIDQMKFGSNDFVPDGISSWSDIGVTAGLGGSASQPALFANDVAETSVAFEFTGLPGEVTHQETTATATDEIAIDLGFPEGMFGYTAENKVVKGTARAQVRYRRVGGAWKHATVAPGLKISSDRAIASTTYFEVTSTDKNPFYVGVSWRPDRDADDIANNPNKVYEVEVTWISTSFLSVVDTTSFVVPVDGILTLGDSGTIQSVDHVLWYVGDTPSQDTPTGRGTVYQRQVEVPYTYDNDNKVDVGGGLYGDTVKVTFFKTPSDLQYRSKTWTWMVMRSLSYVAPSTTGTLKLAVQVKATAEVNGNLQQFSVRGRQQIPVWSNGYDKADPLTWPLQATTNPAWIYHWLLTTCPANKTPVAGSRIDVDEIIAWATDCTTKGFTYSSFVNRETTLGALLLEVCAAGRATFTIRDGLYSVVRDVQQVTPVQYFTPRNSSGFSGSRAFINPIHGLKCRFINPAANWQQDEMIVYDEGYSLDGSVPGTVTATVFESFDFPGVNSPAAVFKLARYHMAVARLRPNTYTWKADVENLACQRGDLVHVAHDVTNWGAGYGRIATISGNAIELDDKIVIPDYKNYSAKIRKEDGTFATSAIKCRDLTKRSSLVVTRATVGTYMGSDGLIKTALGGVPRYEYDEDGTYLGLLVEPAATNLALRSEEFGTTWTNTGLGTMIQNAATAPDGALTAERVHGSTSGAHYLKQLINVTASTQYTFSFWAKNNGGTAARLSLYNQTGAADILSESYFSEISSTKWTRVTRTFTTPVGCTQIGVYMLRDSVGSVDILLWGAQLETGPIATSYIKTLGTATTRNADNITTTLADLGTLSGEMSLVAEFKSRYQAGPNRIFQISEGGYNVNSMLLHFADAANVQTSIYSGSAVQAPPSRPHSSGWGRVAIGCKLNDVGMAYNGGAVLKDTSAVFPVLTGAAIVTIGSFSNAAYLNGHIRKLVFYTRRLTDTELQVASGLEADVPDEFMWDLVTPPAGMNVGDLVLLGETGQEAANLIVTKIQPGADLTATITAVDESPDVYTADAGFVSWTSTIGTRYEPPPDPPTIQALYQGSSNPLDNSGNATPRIVLLISPPSSFGLPRSK